MFQHVTNVSSLATRSALLPHGPSHGLRLAQSRVWPGRPISVREIFAGPLQPIQPVQPTLQRQSVTRRVASGSQHDRTSVIHAAASGFRSAWYRANRERSFSAGSKRFLSTSRPLQQTPDDNRTTSKGDEEEGTILSKLKADPEEPHQQSHLVDRIAHIHRPTKEELLAAATGFWHRLSIRFKWFSIKSARRYNTDDIGAFVSWFFLGHLVWILVGTTTFVSLAILTVNTVFAQETLAGWIGNYLTKSSGVKVVFESAIVPKWNDGVISFRNVFVSRRPGLGRARVSKGSSEAAAAEAAAREHEAGQQAEEAEDTNFTQYDLSIDTINVSLSFARWFNGKGMLKDVEMKGVRGVIDRTNVEAGDPNIDPRSYRHEHVTGDFEIDTFKLEDLLVTVYQPHDFRPFSVSIYSCDLPRLRKQWLFYDLMSANTMSGSFDNSLFTIHPRQVHNRASLSFDDPDTDATIWKKHNRIRIDGLNIDHLNRGVEGPFSWIHEGNVDIVADLMLPADEDGSITKVMSDFYDRMEATVTHSYLHTTHQHDTSDHHDHPPEKAASLSGDDRFIIMDLKVHLNDVHATVPLFTKDISYTNNALIRPIVAYINSKRTFIPINCRIVKRTSEFDGSWTVFDSGLLDDLSRETYDAFARDIVDGKARTRRLKKVGMWTFQLAAQALFIGLAGQLA